MSRKPLTVSMTLAAALSLCLLVIAQDDAAPAPGEAPAAAAEPIAVDMADVSYSLGYDLGARLREDFKRNADIDFNLDQMIAGIATAIKGENPRLDDEQMTRIMADFRNYRAQQVARSNLQYLEENRKKDGVKVTDSGLQYEVMRAGEGERPTANDTVTVHYRGMLVNGQEFDSSYQRGQPATFPLGGVIAGWTEGLQLMEVGSQYRLVIPAELGYGAQGVPQVIPPHSTLIFEVELLSIQPGQ